MNDMDYSNEFVSMSISSEEFLIFPNKEEILAQVDESDEDIRPIFACS